MRNSLYSKLAVKNIKSNKRIFVPYMLMGIIFVAMFFMLVNLANQLDRSLGPMAKTFSPLFTICVTVTAFISFIILLYTNGFLIKYRTRELGLYSILGLDKSAIIKVVSLETLFIALFTIIIGLLTGMLFSRLFYLILTKIINIKSPISFYIDKNALFNTAVFFFIIYLFSIIKNQIKLLSLKPLDILREQEKGEKEPKFKFVGTVLGIVLIGIGYYLAHNTENYVTALSNFVIAVILVIIGTYLLFINVSIAILKFLKSRKSFYYKSNNFLSVSNLIYRMKQNAAGLASICILSTMTLVAVSTSLSLYASLEDSLHKRYLYMYKSTYNDYAEFDLNQVQSKLKEAEAEYNIKFTDSIYYKSSVRVSEIVDGKFGMAKWDFFTNLKNPIGTQYLFLDDYNNINGTNIQLNDDEIFVIGNVQLGDSIIIKGENDAEKLFKIKNLDLPKLEYVDPSLNNIYKDNLVIIFKDLKAFSSISSSASATSLIYQFNFDGSADDIMAFSENFKLQPHSNENRQTARQEFYMVYGIFFFIGIYLGGIFLLVTVLIIYYKQITEGIQDRSRFQLLKKIGIEDKKVKSIINKQVLIVFFSPLIVAFIHIIAAYKNITDILRLLNGINHSLFMQIIAALCVVYALGYVVVYKLTAIRYYKIVNMK